MSDEGMGEGCYLFFYYTALRRRRRRKRERRAVGCSISEEGRPFRLTP